MKTIKINDKPFELPEHMNEMTREQLLFLVKLVKKEVPIQDVKVKILLFCLNARMKPMKNQEFFRVSIDHQTYGFTAEQIMLLSSTFDFLFTQPDERGKCFAHIRLSIPPFPVIQNGRKKLYPPGEALTACTYNQYIYLQTYNAMQEENPDAVYYFLGCLYRPHEERFDPENLNIASMKKLKPDEVTLCLWYWAGSCRTLAERFPRVFPEETLETQGNPYAGHQRLLDFMTKADAAKKEEYKRMKLYDVLFSLEYLLNQQEIKRDEMRIN